MKEAALPSQSVARIVTRV